MFNKEIANFHLKEHQSFIDYLSKDEVSGSYLLIGQNSIGKKDFACGISEIILKNNEKVYKNIHPDLYILDVETDQILVDDINQVESWVFNKPFEASKKIIIIQSADKMNFIAQNKLLKILEEPPDYLFFFLLTANSSLLLPTVESRCIKLNLKRLPDDIISKSLESRFKDKDQLDIALFLLNGSYDEENFYTDEKILDLIDFIRIIYTKEVFSIDKLPNYLDKFFKNKANHHKTIDAIVRLLSLLLRQKHKTLNDSALLNSIIDNEASSYNIGDLVTNIEDVNINLKGTTVNLRISLEEIILDFMLSAKEIKTV